MNKLTLRARAGIAAVLAVFAIVLPAAAAQASIPQGVATSVTCPSGSGTCTEWRYGFSLAGASGQWGVYYTGQWSSSGGSYKIVKVRWVNNTNLPVYWGSFGVNGPTGYLDLMTGSSSTAFGVGAGSSYTFYEASFNGTAKGRYLTHNVGEYSESGGVYPANYRYHAGVNNTPNEAPFLLG